MTEEERIEIQKHIDHWEQRVRQLLEDLRVAEAQVRHWRDVQDDD